MATSATLTPTTRAYLGNSLHGYRLESAARHRALVQYYDLVARRIKQLRQSERSSPRLRCLQAVLQSTASDHSHRFAECHEFLLRDIVELHTWIREADEYGKPQFGQLADRIDALRARLSAHFALEEAGGYMSEPLAAAPQFAASIEKLKSEHPLILTGLDDLSGKLKRRPLPFACCSTARDELHQVLDTLARHKHAENEIWQQAFEQDLGPVIRLEDGRAGMVAHSDRGQNSHGA